MAGTNTDGPPNTGTTRTGKSTEAGVMTMNSMMLAGVAGLCLVLSACSQPPVAGSVQSGSSDVETLSPHNVTTHPQLDFSGADGGSGNQ
jgi:hypothetical protein